MAHDKLAQPKATESKLDTAVPGESTPTGSSPYLHSGVAQPLAIPGYELLEQIGRGGMGVVHRARQVLLNRAVAVKFLPNATAAEPDLIRRFMAEAQVVASIRHANVIDVYDFGETAGVPFIVMELLEKDHLGDRFPVGTAHDPAKFVPVMAKIARGVAAAHEGGTIHRDLKPANILFDRAGEPKVVDFGLAKRENSDLTQTTASMGTPYYMSPEQAKGRSKQVGPQADVWSLGVMLYEGLTGRRPFESENQFSLMMKIVGKNPAPPRELNGSIPESLERIVMKCLSKKPADRYTTAAELARALEAYRRGVPAAKPAPAVRKAEPLVPLMVAPPTEVIPIVRPRRGPTRAVGVPGRRLTWRRFILSSVASIVIAWIAWRWILG